MLESMSEWYVYIMASGRNGTCSKMRKLLRKIIRLAAGVGLVVMANGCSDVRPRVGCLATSTPGIRFLEPDELGPF